ncbi:hypothetical protein PQE68_gp132 [Bacillus phage vB_BanS_Sophrita]|uniref:Uncharacterized protein n=1 Tax=Bacillus phage vB_BanS_Sophrita TaxID=2894790 RepID=A0AAE8YTZ5_9CAUD|nr:hypothetical protein PQE68_gp132 [Bacillus phage vB_BanS_Sophrita]UGO50723.1 hypothetical protein SOPHRITA_132 [Bacillus phage vB_BanS_Sophrita]
MRSIFYGKTKLRYVHFDSHVMNHNFYKYTYYCYPDTKRLEDTIQKLERYREQTGFTYSDNYIYETYIYSRDYQELIERETELVLDIDEEIEINGKRGCIKSKKYDVENDTMHYYTDIIVKTNNDHFEESKISSTTSMINLINKHLVRFKEWDEMAKYNKTAQEEQEQTFIGKIIKWFKG